MSYDVKFTDKSSKRLASSAFQPDRSSRGVENQPLYERHNTGFYSAEPATALVDGDIVQINELRTLTWEDETVYSNTAEPILSDGEQVYHEGEFLFDFDTLSNEVVTSNSEPIGTGEFTFGSGDLSSLIDDVDTLVEDGSSVLVVYDEREGAKRGVGAGAGIESEILHDC